MQVLALFWWVFFFVFFFCLIKTIEIGNMRNWTQVQMTNKSWTDMFHNDIQDLIGHVQRSNRIHWHLSKSYFKSVTEFTSSIIHLRSTPTNKEQGWLTCTIDCLVSTGQKLKNVRIMIWFHNNQDLSGPIQRRNRILWYLSKELFQEHQ